MKYIVSFKVRYSHSEKHNATSKAQEDVVRTMKSLGAVDVGIWFPIFYFPFTKRSVPLITGLLAFFSIISFVFTLKSGDVVYLQNCDFKWHSFLIKQAHKRNVKVVVIVHDIGFVRFPNKPSKYEFKNLQNADRVLVHTERFKQLLVEKGITTEMDYFNLFDYYSDSPMMNNDEVFANKNKIVFAGNLQKSGFLRKWIDSNVEGINVFLYGILGDLIIPSQSNFSYQGLFSSSETGIIKGGWGLVWDGPDIESCNGEYGEYLKYNSSHKLSLYSVCGLPLIVWKQSSLASWIEDNKLGIVVSSLFDIPESISQVSDSLYREMIKNIESVGKDLRDGIYLKRVVEG